MNDRCIIVLTVGRSGSSAIAGALDRLGVKMGDCYMEANDANPKGFYEDLILNKMLQTTLDQQQLSGYFKRRRKEIIWGMKDPLLVHKLDKILPYLGDKKIVVAKRDREEVIQSCKRIWNKANYQEIRSKEKLIEHWISKIESTVIWYKDLIENTEQTICKLADFVYEDIDNTVPDVTEAVKFIDPALYRCRNK